MKKCAIAVLVLLFSLSALASDERVLENGARVLLWPQPGSGTVLIAVAVDAGGLDEPAERAGLSHFLEHLLFDGFDDLDERGVTEAFERISAYVNAFTRAQTTVFFVLVPRDEAPRAAELLAGMLTRSTISEASFEKERGVILEELARGTAMPGQAREAAMQALLWEGTPGARNVGGVPRAVAATTREEVVTYWKERYRPEAMRILVGGELDETLVNAVLGPFASMAARDAALPRSDVDPLSWKGWGQARFARAPESDPRSALDLVIATPSDAESSHLELLARWLGDDASPLARRFAESGRARVTVSRMPRLPRDLIQVRLEPLGDDESAETLLEDLLTALCEAAASGPRDEDVARILRAWRQERVLDTQRLHYAAVLFGEDFATRQGPLAQVMRPPAIDGAAMRDVAKAVLAEAFPLMRAAWLGPGEPSGPLSLAGFASRPGAGTSVPRDAESVLGAQVTTLDNGLVLGVLEEPGSEVFGVHLLVADRALAEAPAPVGSADLLHRLIGEGSALADANAIARRLQRLGVEMKSADLPQIPFDDYYNRPWFSYVRLEGPAASLGEALALLAECVRVPAWDEKAFKRALAAHERARKAGESPSQRASLAMRRALLGAEHPLVMRVAGDPAGEGTDETTLRALLGAWPQGYFAPERVILTIAGPDHAVALRELVEDLFGGGPSRAPKRGPYPEPSSGEGGASKGDAKGAKEVESLHLSWGALHGVPSERRAALRLAITALSDRLVSEVREKRGLSYSPGAGTSVMPGGAWMISASVATRPENRDAVIEVVEDVLASLAASPPNAEEIARLVARSRRSEMLRTLSAASRAYRLGKALLDGPALSPLTLTSEDLAKVTPEQLADAARDYLAPARLVFVETR